MYKKIFLVICLASSGLCIDATRQGLNYKQSTSSYCFIQLTESTIQQCHNLKLVFFFVKLNNIDLILLKDSICTFI